jgi:hypothetical protein
MKHSEAPIRWQSAGVSLFGGVAERRREPDGITITCHENHVPWFVEKEMERLYENIFSSLVQFKIYGAVVGHMNTYVVRKGDQIITIFLFFRENGKVRVLNEVIRIDEEDIRRFTEYIFTTYKSTTVISFKAVETNISRLTFPYQRFNYSEDIVLALPATSKEYLAMLGKNTRRNIKRYTDKLMRDFPSFKYRVCVKEEVDKRHIRDIIRLNRERMAGKNKASLIDDDETDHIIDLVSECGVVGIAEIDGRVCAGTISYRVGSNYFLSVLAHDPGYDDYWLGILCCYLTICECIARDGKDFHFLWGQYEYKYTLLATPRNLDHLNVYRSYGHFLGHAGFALGCAYEGYKRRLTQWLRNAKHHQGILPRLATSIVGQLRAWRGRGFAARMK